MPELKTVAQKKRWTAAELRALPASQRDAILADVAERAVNAYASGSDLTQFEAFGEEDLHGYSSDTKAEPR